MHAPTLKRPTLNRYVGLALVLGLAASVALNVVMLARSDDDTASISDVPAASAQSTHTMRRFADAKENQIDSAQAAASPRHTPAVNSRHFDNEFGQVDVMQVQADQNAHAAATSRYVGNAFGQVDVMQVLADENAVLAARERFIKSKFDRMAGR